MSVNEEMSASGRFEVTTMRGKKTFVSVNNHGLTRDDKPGEVYPLAATVLSAWTIGHPDLLYGSALQFQCGRRRFVLGGVDHRAPTKTPFEAPPVDLMVDASVPASDFDQIFALVARVRGWDVRRSEREPTRCRLLPNTSKGWSESNFPWGDFIQRRKRKKLPSLAMDVGDGSVRVIDPATNELVASAPDTHVTAEPLNYSGHPSAISEKISNIVWVVHEWESPPTGAHAVLYVEVPGFEPMTITAPKHFRSPSSRFEWHGDVPRVHKMMPNYLVSGMDWLTLTAAFGLSHRVQDEYVDWIDGTLGT
jgi:hypothetical protein